MSLVSIRTAAPGVLSP